MEFEPLSDSAVEDRNNIVLLVPLRSSRSISSDAADRVLVARARGQWLLMMSVKIAQKQIGYAINFFYLVII